MRINGYCAGKNGTAYNVWVDIVTVSQSIEENYSTVNCKSYLQAKSFSNSAWNLNSNNYCWITADGQGRSNNRNIDTRNYALVLLKDENYIIKHGLDGKKSFYFDSGFFISSNTLTGGRVEGWITLPVIARSSHCSINDFILENDIYINTNRSSANFTHVIDLYVADTKILSRDNISQDIIIKFSDDEVTQIYNLMNTVLTSQVRINCSTWNGTTLIGYTDSYCTCHIDKEKNKPIFTEGLVRYYYKDTIEEQNGVTIPYGNIRGSTQIVYSGFSFESQNGAPMKKLRLEMGTSKLDKEYDQESDVQSIGRLVTPLENVDSFSLIGIDSRGLETVIGKYIRPCEYVQPTIVKAASRRKNGVEAETYLDLEIKIQQPLIENIKNDILALIYEVDNGNRMLDIAEELKSGVYNEETGILTKNDIQIHESGDGGGFSIGKEFDIKFTLENGVSEETTLGPRIVWDTTEFFVNINDGKFLDGHYKDSGGNYHTGYHCLPSDQFEHVFEGSMCFNNVSLHKNVSYEDEIVTFYTLANKKVYMKFVKIDNIAFTGGNSNIDIDNSYNILSMIANGRVAGTFHQIPYVDATNHYSYNLTKTETKYSFNTISNLTGNWDEINITIYYTK